MSEYDYPTPPPMVEAIPSKVTNRTSAETDLRRADLGYYIAKCHFRSTCMSTILSIFDQAANHSRPELRQRRMNRILVYAGCFNPPHVAHQRLLEHALQCREDLNIIAAIVLPFDDKKVRSKYRRKKDIGVVFTKSQRAKLWQGDPRLHDFVWVYDRSMEEWYMFQGRLRRAVERDGFSLEFVSLFGSDGVRHGKPSARMSYGCKQMIISDAGRKAKFITEEGELLRLIRCDPWMTVSADKRHAIWRVIDRKASVDNALSFKGSSAKPEYYDDLFEETELDFIDKLEGVAICNRTDFPDEWICFIPAGVEGSESQREINSTRIRHIIKTYPIKQLHKRLEGKALSPRKLFEFVQDIRSLH
ncbi:uncharacterized protein F4822DRAFT_162037 [Hypoxylon trugodes]|uniref:uncharacterized protein n=1 Tax=Hypoxylon trugodes TaxID=326681 RepID=UPI002195B6C9|nr:uncharacterized protein F4822DRAFT_162037 [Hypoxylon trugodes]KAI1390716.1 hypothetical protein F4822DRAFT_162037 [Hypoxylon trugodes]